jgi:nitrogen fixation-related uncharacterized protein
MRQKLVLARTLVMGGALLAAVAPHMALAHDNIGGDELAATNWMLIAALVAILTGIFFGLWAWQSGQFTNVEESKYRMLENAEDYDTIMAEAEAREKQARSAEASGRAGTATQASPVGGDTGTGTGTDTGTGTLQAAVPAKVASADRTAHA